MGTPVQAHWGWLGDATAVIEMAAASGLHWVPREQRDACLASSYGTGELIRQALDAGAKRIILGLGGSATNDGGAGLLQALGLRLLDEQGRELPPGGAALAGLDQLDLSGLDARLLSVQVEVAADVDNPCAARVVPPRCSVRRRARPPRRSSNWMLPSGASRASLPRRWGRITPVFRVSARLVVSVLPRVPS